MQGFVLGASSGGGPADLREVDQDLRASIESGPGSHSMGSHMSRQRPVRVQGSDPRNGRAAGAGGRCMEKLERFDRCGRRPSRDLRRSGRRPDRPRPIPALSDQRSAPERGRPSTPRPSATAIRIRSSSDQAPRSRPIPGSRPRRVTGGVRTSSDVGKDVGGIDLALLVEPDQAAQIGPHRQQNGPQVRCRDRRRPASGW